MKPPFVVFTDLDGCLHDHRDAEGVAARPALAALRALDVPLVLCSAKTRAELRRHHEALAPQAPFIVENGGAIVIPGAGIPGPGAPARADGVPTVVELGIRYPALVECLRDLRRTTRLPLRGFSDMSLREVAFFTSLSERDAAAAMEREYDEPFVAALTPEEETRLGEHARRLGLSVRRGGRFFHLSGRRHDKGRAVDIVTRLYRAEWPGIETVGCGYGAGDRSLLRAVDHAIVIPREPGVAEPALLRSGWRVAVAPGPAGWNAEILEILGHAAAWPTLLAARRSA